MKRKGPHCDLAFKRHDPALSPILCRVFYILFTKAHQTQPALNLRTTDQVVDNLSTTVAQGEYAAISY